jgi:hypothetical protein
MVFTKKYSPCLAVLGMQLLLLSGSLLADTDGFLIADINGRNGFTIDHGFHLDGVRPAITNTTSFIGDINNDGLDDVLLSNISSAQQDDQSGSVAVVFGRAGLYPSIIEIDDLDGSNGFLIVGAEFTRLGVFVSAAGDINNDGIDDVVMSTLGGGVSYLLFGRDSGFPAQFSINDLTPSQGIRVSVHNSATGNSGTPTSARYAGDVNHDGIDDVIFGVPEDITNEVSGAYVVFGGSNLPPVINLFELNGQDGFAMEASLVGNTPVGSSVSAAGDINHDGIDDVMVSSVLGTAGNEVFNGAAFVVFGRSSAFPARMDLSMLNGSGGFLMVGSGTFGGFGHALSAIGDVNQDGIDDFAVGAYRFEGDQAQSGRAYVFFGSDAGFAPSINAESLNGSNGFILSSNEFLANFGSGIASEIDFNRDGINDIVVGAPGSVARRGMRGRVYVVYGQAEAYPERIDVDTLSADAGVVLIGNENDRLGVSVDQAGDLNQDGFADLLISANGGVDGALRTVEVKHHLVFNNATEVVFANSFEVSP